MNVNLSSAGCHVSLVVGVGMIESAPWKEVSRIKGVGQGLGCSKYTWTKIKTKYCKLDVELLSLASKTQRAKIKYLY